MRSLDRRHFTLGLVGLGTLASPAMAQKVCMPAAAGKVLLTVDGKISCTGADGKASFDAAMLERLGMVTIETNTPWYTGTMKFEGVPMSVLMKTVGSSGTKLTAVALNDYTTEIPISDFDQYKPILAIKRNGEYMPVKDKGPLFIVYPYDSNPELKSQKFYSKSAWQVARLTVS